jgi:hypothetical protein
MHGRWSTKRVVHHARKQRDGGRHHGARARRAQQRAWPTFATTLPRLLQRLGERGWPLPGSRVPVVDATRGSRVMSGAGMSPRRRSGRARARSARPGPLKPARHGAEKLLLMWAPESDLLRNLDQKTPSIPHHRSHHADQAGQILPFLEHGFLRILEAPRALLALRVLQPRKSQ